jgi:hypothetical protein
MELLDENVPGWERRVDLRTLDLSSCTECVVGQLYGAQETDFVQGGNQTLLTGYRALGVDVPERYGFALTFKNWRVTYGGLTRAWKRQIKRRLAEARP